MRLFLLALCMVSITACGIKRPLIAPRDIPEYERKRAEKLKRHQLEEIPAPAQQGAR